MPSNRVPSPGGWQTPPGSRPGWDWVPPDGAVFDISIAPLWARVGFYVPVLDRRVRQWLWKHGYYTVVPPTDGR
jgi:hypothetical protein